MIPPKPQKPPLPPKPDQKPLKVNTKTANINQPKEGKTSSSQNQKRKNIFIIVALILLAAAAIAGAFFLLQERQDIRKAAAPSDLPSCDNYTTTRCYGECEGCIEYEICEIDGGGWCRNRLINPDSPRCGPDCGEDSGGGDDGGSGDEEAQTCSPENPGAENSWCVSQHSQETKENATWSCEPNSPDSGDDGCLQICQSGYVWESDFSKCIETAGESGQLICQRINNHEIKITNNTGTTIPYEKIVFRGCPYDSADCQGSQYRTEYVQPSINTGQTKTESTAPAYCETIQLDIKSLSSQYSCLTSEGQPWDGGVAFAIDHHWDETCEEDEPPTPTEPEPTITQPEYSCNCHTIKIYDQDKNLINADNLENLRAGDLIYIGVVANNGYPNYPVTKAQIRVNRNYWLEQDETTEKIDHDHPAHLVEFIKPYTIPDGILNFKVEAEVYLDAPGDLGGWL